VALARELGIEGSRERVPRLGTDRRGARRKLNESRCKQRVCLLDETREEGDRIRVRSAGPRQRDVGGRAPVIARVADLAGSTGKAQHPGIPGFREEALGR
jgi:hypothetical protein